MRRFLKYELDRYLQGRGGELIEELPIKLVENQPYIHYQEREPRDVCAEGRHRRGPGQPGAQEFHRLNGVSSTAIFPTSADLIAEFRAVAGDEHQALITDLFEKIIIFDLKVTEATVEEARRWILK